MPFTQSTPLSSIPMNLDTITAPFRRRFSSRASSAPSSPSSPDADDQRRPTLCNIYTLENRLSPDDGPWIVTEREISPTPDPAGRILSGPSEWDSEDAQEGQYRPFPTMREICIEEGIGYPLERFPNQYRPCSLMSVEVGYMEDISLKPEVGSETSHNRRLSGGSMRRLSISAMKAGRRARKLSGDLGRMAGKLIGQALKNVSSLSKGGKKLPNEDSNWNIYGHVDLGHEIDGGDWRKGESDAFGTVKW